MSDVEQTRSFLAAYLASGTHTFFCPGFLPGLGRTIWKAPGGNVSMQEPQDVQEILIPRNKDSDPEGSLKFCVFCMLALGMSS